MTADILKEAPNRSNCFDSCFNPVPEISGVGFAQFRPDLAEGLAWVATHDSFHLSTPCCEIEGLNVRPDRSISQRSLRNIADQRRGGGDFSLNVTDWDSSSA
tara:strand:- start:468 stop:773 length:306 start_codon:yes stop_codon:yes gene_type:complete